MPIWQYGNILICHISILAYYFPINPIMSKIVQAGACLPPAGGLCSVAISAHEAELSRETVPGWPGEERQCYSP